jgi:PHD/YefM family antitoxin component YafN of YafNO toxin-antitoxin module
MYGVIDLKQRYVIIKNSGFDDAVILDENYLQMLKDTPNSEERDQYRKLRAVIKDRIEQLKGNEKQ